MTTTLLLPPWHEDPTGPISVYKRFRHLVDEVVIMGNFSDCPHDLAFAAKTAVVKTNLDFVNRLDNDPHTVFVLGRHDIQYLINDPKVRVGGYSEVTQKLYDSYIDCYPSVRLGYYAQGWLLSSCGWNKEDFGAFQTRDQAHLDKLSDAALGSTLPASTHALLHYSTALGNKIPDHLGSPLGRAWREFVPVEDLNQIMTSTPTELPRVLYSKGAVNINMNCGYNRVFFIKDKVLWSARNTPDTPDLDTGLIYVAKAMEPPKALPAGNTVPWADMEARYAY
jgi:hypothetical protein